MCNQSRTYKASICLFFLNVIKFIINLVLSNNEGKTLEMEGQPDADTGKHIDEVVKLIQILSNREYDSKTCGIALVIHHQVAEPKWENV